MLLYHVVYARVDVEGEAYNRNREHKGYVVQPWRPTSTEESLKGYIFIMCKSVVQ